MRPWDRRDWLRASGTASAAAALGLPRAAKAAPKAAVRETTVIRTAKGITVRCTLSPSGRGQGEGCENPPVIPFAVLSRQPELHHGWPTLARCQSGRLLLVYSGGREAQVCPFGRVEFVQSDDCGRNCTWPRVLLDTAIDDRDSGVLETSKGSILVTILTSSAYESILEQAEKNPVPEKAAWPLVPERIEHAQTAHPSSHSRPTQGGTRDVDDPVVHLPDDHSLAQFPRVRPNHPAVPFPIDFCRGGR